MGLAGQVTPRCLQYAPAHGVMARGSRPAGQCFGGSGWGQSLSSDLSLAVETCFPHQGSSGYDLSVVLPSLLPESSEKSLISLYLYFPLYFLARGLSVVCNRSLTDAILCTDTQNWKALKVQSEKCTPNSQQCLLLRREARESSQGW